MKGARLLQGLLFALVVSQLFLWLDHSIFGLEARSLDMRFQLRGPRDLSHSPIILVEVDNRTYKDLNERFPFSRAYTARVLRNLKRAGVDLILLDIQFTERVTGDSLGLAELASALRDCAPVVLSGELVQERRGHKRLDPPLPELLASGQPWGLINDLNDEDGVNRLYPLFWPSPAGDEKLPSLGAWVPLLHSSSGAEGIGAIEDHRLPLGDTRVLLEPGWGNAFRINYYGPPGSFPTYSYSSIMDDADFELAEPDFDTNYMEQFMDRELFDLLWAGEEHPFEGRIALVGVSATDLHDDKRTPFFHYGDTRRLMPGVEVHAHALQTLLDERWIHLPLRGPLGYLPVVAMALLGGAAIAWLGPLRSLLLLLPLGFAHAAGTQWLFATRDWWIELTTPLVALSAAWTFGLLQQFLLARRERAQIRGMFAQYVPEAVVSELIKSPDKLVLGGEEREMSALFSDVEGFTSISERLSPTQLVDLLNEYLTLMTEQISQEGGIIDKYEGDAIIAEFGAPLPCEDHARRAARSAVRMQRELALLRDKWAGEGKPLLKARIGINSGPMVVGNMGSRQIFDYTAMGDAMNLASRLEGVNKFYGSYLMCSRESWEQLGEDFLGRPLDLIRVKGKNLPVEIWEILEMRDGLDSQRQEQVAERVRRWQAARELYLARRWPEANAAFASLHAEYPEDGPAHVFAARCALYSTDPPADDWDGVENMTEK